MHPQRVERGLLIEEVADETIVFDRVRHRAHCLNRVAACVWRHCNGHNTAAQIAALATAELGMAIDEQVVEIAWQQLSKAALLQKPSYVPGDKKARREMLRKLAAAAVLVPTVMTVIAPTAAQAASSVNTCAGQSGSDNICRTFSCPGGKTCKNAGGGLAECACK